MRFILKSAHIEDINKAARMGFIDGVIVPRAEAERTGRNYDHLIHSALQLPFTVIGHELKELSGTDLRAEIMGYNELMSDRLVAFLPMTLSSLQVLRKNEVAPLQLGVQYAVTLVQQLAAVESGAKVLLIHAKQLVKYGLHIQEALSDLLRILQKYQPGCEIWVEIATGGTETNRLIALGIDGLVFTWDMLEELFYHPVTDQLLERRMTPWTQVVTE